jgi:DNA-binding MarR family transcriptional regulator
MQVHRTAAARPRTTPRKTREPDPAALRSWLSVVAAYHLCGELMARRLAPLGLRTAEHEILVNLRREPGLSQQTLAARCFTAKSHISGLLTDLESRGWVRREPDPADARARCLFLQPAGARLAERSAAVQNGIVEIMAGAIDSQAMAQVQEAMLAVSAQLEAAIAAEP